MSLDCTLLALCYGDYPDLHARCVSSLLATTPDTVPLRLWLNEVGKASLASLSAVLGADVPDPAGMQGGVGLSCRGREVRLYSRGNANSLKYPAMREMLRDPAVSTEWVCWVDDDTWFSPGSPWWSVAGKLAPDCDYMGEQWVAAHDASRQTFVKGQPWYAGVDVRVPWRGGQTVPGSVFFTGGLWFARTANLLKWDWPPTSLRHNGGDTLLGDLASQQKWRRKPIPTERDARHRGSGVHVNNAKRRGYSEPPVGSSKAR